MAIPAMAFAVPRCANLSTEAPASSARTTYSASASYLGQPATFGGAISRTACPGGYPLPSAMGSPRAAAASGRWVGFQQATSASASVLASASASKAASSSTSTTMAASPTTSAAQGGATTSLVSAMAGGRTAAATAAQQSVAAASPKQHVQQRPRSVAFSGSSVVIPAAAPKSQQQQSTQSVTTPSLPIASARNRQPFVSISIPSCPVSPRSPAGALSMTEWTPTAAGKSAALTPRMTTSVSTPVSLPVGNDQTPKSTPASLASANRSFHRAATTGLGSFFGLSSGRQLPNFVAPSRVPPSPASVETIIGSKIAVIAPGAGTGSNKDVYANLARCCSVDIIGRSSASYDRYPEWWEEGHPAPNLATFAEEELRKGWIDRCDVVLVGSRGGQAVLPAMWEKAGSRVPPVVVINGGCAMDLPRRVRWPDKAVSFLLIGGKDYFREKRTLDEYLFETKRWVPLRNTSTAILLIEEMGHMPRSELLDALLPRLLAVVLKWKRAATAPKEEMLEILDCLHASGWHAKLLYKTQTGDWSRTVESGARARCTTQMYTSANGTAPMEALASHEKSGFEFRRQWAASAVIPVGGGAATARPATAATTPVAAATSTSTSTRCSVERMTSVASTCVGTTRTAASSTSSESSSSGSSESPFFGRALPSPRSSPTKAQSITPASALSMQAAAPPSVASTPSATALQATTTTTRRRTTTTTTTTTALRPSGMSASPLSPATALPPAYVDLALAAPRVLAESVSAGPRTDLPGSSPSQRNGGMTQTSQARPAPAKTFTQEGLASRHSFGGRSAGTISAVFPFTLPVPLPIYQHHQQQQQSVTYQQRPQSARVPYRREQTAMAALQTSHYDVIHHESTKALVTHC